MNLTSKISLFVIAFTLFNCSESETNTSTESEEQMIDDYSTKIDSLLQISSPRKFNGLISITRDGATVTPLI